ncbi:hypothetical protein ANN_11680 [Periplaneta americana]|uniref:Uncharacterized protein n=1 Tax=Periplaneta americana TaxID=6978 RepID=A0ABQ8T5Q8_PERAM|nr:hypothetical protein ANN_11680 [Periplaneta americana]
MVAAKCSRLIARTLIRAISFYGDSKKEKVYQRRPENVVQLRALLVELCRALSEDLCRKVVTNCVPTHYKPSGRSPINLGTDRLDIATCIHTLLSTDVHIRTDHVRYTLRYLHCFSVVSCPHPSDSALTGILVNTKCRLRRPECDRGYCDDEIRDTNRQGMMMGVIVTFDPQFVRKNCEENNCSWFVFKYCTVSSARRSFVITSLRKGIQPKKVIEMWAGMRGDRTGPRMKGIRCMKTGDVMTANNLFSETQQQKSSPSHSLRNYLLLLVETEFVERHDTATACLQSVNETHSNIRETSRTRLNVCNYTM